MPKKDTKFDKTLEEFVKIKETCKSKVKELLEDGILTPDMLEFDFDEGEEKVDVEHMIVYKNAETSKLEKTYVVEFSIRVREA